MAARGMEDEPPTCAVCLGSFRDPRFLPCHHSFCASCIKDVADRHHGGDFPCPVCRRVTSLPSGGVASLQVNFYIETAQTPGQKQAPVSDMCSIHVDKKLEFFCEPCDQALCLNCKLTEHELHKTVDLSTAASRKKKDLQTDLHSLRRALCAVEKSVTSLEEERRALGKKKAAVARNINDRHAIVLAIANAKRDKELRSLSSLHEDLDGDLAEAVGRQEAHKAELTSLLHKGNQAMTSSSDSDVIAVSREVRSGLGSQGGLDAPTSRQQALLRRPVLRANVRTNIVVQTVRDYLGGARVVEVEETEPEMRVRECFNCGQEPNVEVFSLCHIDGGPPTLNVSYEGCGMEKYSPWIKFLETGIKVYTDDTDGSKTRVSFKRFAKGKAMFTNQRLGRFSTFCKSPAAANFELVNDLSGEAGVYRDTVVSSDPLKTKDTIEFSIQVGLHRAFDVDGPEQHFAVVEEATASSHWRSVRLYQRSSKQAVSTYIPPKLPFQPTDVCFYTLGKEQVLLITDEANDAVHVVSVKEGSMRFESYLCAGDPSLVQPTAITVDIHDRLWLACRGGAVLLMEKIVP